MRGVGRCGRGFGALRWWRDERILRRSERWRRWRSPGWRIRCLLDERRSRRNRRLPGWFPHVHSLRWIGILLHWKSRLLLLMPVASGSHLLMAVAERAVEVVDPGKGTMLLVQVLLQE